MANYEFDRGICAFALVTPGRVEGKHCEISITVYAYSMEELSKHLLC